jgi:hypothetical protein
MTLFYLSRASLNTSDTDEAISNADLNDDIEVMIHSFIANLPTSKERLTQLKQMTAEDESLQQLKTLIKNGWPIHRQLPPC